MVKGKNFTKEEIGLAQIDLGPIEQVLSAEFMPDLPPGELGRFRLVNALERKFGKDYRMLKGARQVLEHFDNETQTVRDTLKLKEQINGKRI